MTSIYDEILDDEAAATNEAGASLAQARAIKPDEAAEAIDQADRRGMAPEAARRNLERLRQADRKSFYDQLISENPGTREFVRDPANAAIAQDDLEGLAGIEQNVRAAGGTALDAKNQEWLAGLSGLERSAGEAALWMRDVQQGFLKGAVGDFAGRALQGSARVYEMLSRRGLEAIFASQEMLTGVDLSEHIDIDKITSDTGVEKWLYETGQDIEGVGRRMGPSRFRQGLHTDIAGGVGQVGGQIALGAIPGIGPALTASATIAQGADIQADAMAEENARRLANGEAPIDQATADAAIAGGGLITGISEKIGLDLLLKRVPPKLRNNFIRGLADTGLGGIGEASQEIVEGVMQGVLSQQLFAPDTEIFEGIVDEGIVAGGTGAVVRGVINLATKGRAVAYEHEAAERAGETEAMLMSLGEGAAASKLRERNPKRFEKFVESVTKQGGVESVYVDGEALAQFYQSKVADETERAQLFEQLGVTTQLESARAAGGAVKIDLAKFATIVGGQGDFGALVKDAKFRPEDMTPNEAARFRQEAKEGGDALERAFKREGEKAFQQLQTDAPAMQVYEAVRRDLERAGRAPDVAKTEAMLHLGHARVIAANGVDPAAWYRDRFGFSIEGPGAGAQTLAEADADGNAFEMLAELAADPETESAAAPEPAGPVVNRRVEKPDAGSVVELDPTEIQTDAKTFQFKGRTDSQGVSDQLKGVKRWDATFSGTAIVYEKADGSRFIVDGHQRLGLAKRLTAEGQQGIRIRAEVLREADGVTPEQARLKGALKNIAEGGESTSAVDVATVLKEGGDQKEIDAVIPPRRRSYRDGLVLARLGDVAWGMLRNEMIAPQLAAEIAARIADPAQQVAAIEYFRLDPPQNRDQARLVVDQIVNAGFTSGVELTLFGKEAFAESLMIERAAVLDAALRTLSRRKSAFKMALDRSEILAAAGNTISVDTTQAALSDNELIAHFVRSQATRRGAISDTLTEAARAYKGGIKRSDAVQNFLQVVAEMQGLDDIDAPEQAVDQASRDAVRGALTEAARATEAADQRVLVSMDSGDLLASDREYDAIVLDAYAGARPGGDLRHAYDLLAPGGRVAAIIDDADFDDGPTADWLRDRNQARGLTPDGRAFVSILKPEGPTLFQSPSPRAEVDAFIGETQLNADVEDIFARAEEAQRDLGLIGLRVSRITSAVFKNPGVKNRERATQKANEDYAGRFGMMTDIARGAVIVTHPRDAEAAIDELVDAGFTLLDKGWKRLSSGYADRKVLFRHPNGTVGELQILEATMQAAKDNGGHDLYKAARQPDVAPEEAARLNAEMVALYAEAFASAGSVWASVFSSPSESVVISPDSGRANGNRAANWASDSGSPLSSMERIDRSPPDDRDQPASPPNQVNRDRSPEGDVTSTQGRNSESQNSIDIGTSTENVVRRRRHYQPATGNSEVDRTFLDDRPGFKALADAARPDDTVDSYLERNQELVTHWFGVDDTSFRETLEDEAARPYKGRERDFREKIDDAVRSYTRSYKALWTLSGIPFTAKGGQAEVYRRVYDAQTAMGVNFLTIAEAAQKYYKLKRAEWRDRQHAPAKAQWLAPGVTPEPLTAAERKVIDELRSRIRDRTERDGAAGGLRGPEDGQAGSRGVLGRPGSRRGDEQPIQRDAQGDAPRRGGGGPAVGGRRGVRPPKGPLFQSAFHGSGVDAPFRRFDSQYISTGQGVAAFGYGHYFSASEEIAGQYRRKLSGRDDGGRTYAVEIPDADTMLPWGGLFMAMPEQTQKRLRSILADDELAPAITGERIYRRLAARLGGDKAASRALDAVGIPGVVYSDPTFGDDNFVVFDDAEIAINRFYQPSWGGTPPKETPPLIWARDGGAAAFEQDRSRPSEAPRGAIDFGEHETVVSLFRGADLSTVIHESGHFFLESMAQLAQEPTATDALKADMAAIVDWLGATPGDPFTVEQHERFARGFEAYAMEGKAPTAELRPAFRRFKLWLTAIYRQIARLDVKLTDEVRRAFDRMIATEDEIAAAESRNEYDTTAQALKEAGLLEGRALDDYLALTKAARAEAEEEIEREKLREAARRATTIYREAEIQAETAARRELLDEPIMAAMRFLLYEDVEDVPAELQGKRLDAKAIVKRHGGKQRLKAFPRGRKHAYTWDKDKAVDPEEIAVLFGFDGATSFLAALEKATPWRQALKAKTDEKLRARFGDFNQGIADLAEEAVRNEQRAQVIETELRVMRTKLGDRAPTPAQELKRLAAQTIAQRTVKDIQSPEHFLQEERRAARRAERRLAAGDIQGAAQAKQSQMVNMALFRAAKDAQKNINKTLDLVRRLKKDGPRSSIHGENVKQIDQLLALYDFRKLSAKELEGRQALADWIVEQEQQGFEVRIPKAIRRAADMAQRRFWRDLSLEDLRDVDIALRNIAHLGRQRQELINEQKRIELDAAATEIAESIAKNAKAKPQKAKHDLGFWDSAKRPVGLFFTAHTKPEFLFDRLDGFKKGAAWKRLFAPLAAAQNRESDMMHDVSRKLGDVFGRYTRVERAGWGRKSYYVDSLGKSFDKRTLLSIALNTGNEYNREALLEGYDWTDAQLNEILSHLDERDWDAVQDAWDLVDSYWPEIKRFEEEMAGVAPEKVQADPFVTPGGKRMKGGYYPIRFDTDLTYKAFKREEAVSVQEMFGGNWAKPQTRHGHTIERQGTGGQPLRLDLGVLTEHVTQVIHDVTHRKAVMDVDRLLQHREVRAAIEDTAGRDAYRSLRPWLEQIAASRRVDGNGTIDRIAAHTRHGASIVYMGWKLTTAIVQPLGYLQSLDQLGVKWGSIGLARTFGVPWRLGQRVGWVLEQSAMMRNRQRTFDRDAADALKKIGIKGFTYELNQSFFWMIGFLDMAVSIPTWTGGYERARHAGKSHEDAVAEADSVVRMSQSAGGAADLAAVQRGTDTHKLFTLAYSYFNVLFNLIDRRLRKSGKPGIKRTPELIGSMIALWFAPAILAELIAGRGPDEEDDEDWLLWTANKVGSYPFLTMVGVRDVVGVTASEFEASVPAADAFTAAGKALAATQAIVDDDVEWTRGNTRAVVDAVGYWGKLPTRQMWLTSEYVYEYMKGDEELSIYKALVTGPDRD